MTDQTNTPPKKTKTLRDHLMEIEVILERGRRKTQHHVCDSFIAVNAALDSIHQRLADDLFQSREGR